MSSPDLMRPDDIALLKQASRDVRRTIRGAVAFAGLCDQGRVRVTATAGAVTRGLSSIVLGPSRGLGGRSWVVGRPMAVDDYATAPEITHDFDGQILGEGIVSLAVAPIVVRERLRGLLYAGTRSRSTGSDLARHLERHALQVARELDIRDRVDQRTRMLLAFSDGTIAVDSKLHTRVESIASRTSDPDTAAELRALFEGARSTASHAAPDETSGLTPRQAEILGLVALGLRNADIAAHLGLTVSTVKSYLRTAMERLHAPTRQAAVVEARRRGLLR